nr:polymorphic toxin-type HINT domain-containing protein [Leptospira alexanderi]
MHYTKLYWVPAKDLRSGEASVLSNEKTLEIESITISERTTTVYNFEVEDAHSYYVGEGWDFSSQ